jgi:RNA polymerase sigma-70 factor (ECF subfamily)
LRYNQVAMEKGTNEAAALSYRSGSGASPVQDEDAPFVVLAREGDLNAFETLVHKHQKRMLNIAYRLLDDYDEACDAVQEAFVSAFRHLAGFRGEAKFTTWLTTITVNVSRNRLKQLKSRKGREAYSLDDPIETPDGDMKRDPASDEPSALKKLEQREVREHVRGCIEKLEPDFREVLVLRDLQDFSYDDIGNILKVRAGTVKSRLFRAREMVKECLKRVMGEL